MGFAKGSSQSNLYRCATLFLARQAARSYFKAGTVTGGSERVVLPIGERVGAGTENLLLWLTSPRLLIITEVRNKIPRLVRFEVCQNGSKSPVSFFGVGDEWRRRVNPILTLRSSCYSGPPHEKAGRELDGVPFRRLILLLMFRACFDDQTKGVTWWTGTHHRESAVYPARTCRNCKPPNKRLE